MADEKKKSTTPVMSQGISMGVALAIVLSWESNHAVLWAIGHGFLSWFYVIYWCVEHRL